MMPSGSMASIQWKRAIGSRRERRRTDRGDGDEISDSRAIRRVGELGRDGRFWTCEWDSGGRRLGQILGPGFHGLAVDM